MMHDFAITRTHVVFFDLPGRVRPRLVQPASIRTAGTTTTRARVGVMPRDGGDADVALVRRRPLLRVPPDERVRRRRHGRGRRRAPPDDVREAQRADRTTAPRRRSTGGRSTTPAGKVREERLDDRGQEFPRVNETPARVASTATATRSSWSTPRPRSTARLPEARLRAGHDRGARLRRAAACRASSCSCRRDGATRGRRLADRLRLRRGDATAATSSSSTRHDFTAAPVATVHLPAACRSASTATGSPINPELSVAVG